MSSTSEELPEYQIFHILKNGEQESIGPFSQNRLAEMLNAKEVQATDLVYYSELPDWTPISEVFDFHRAVTNLQLDGQDAEAVAETFAFIDERSKPDEEIYYIAVQNFPALSLTSSVKLRAPRSVVLTNLRFCVVKPKLMGDTSFEEFTLDQIERTVVYLDDGDDEGGFEIVPQFGDSETVSKIPAAQLARLEEIAGDLLADEEDIEADEGGDERSRAAN